ncbi:hypothetical protein HMPREF0682_0468, partial [Propionibacterium acidifaciens F0233]
MRVRARSRGRALVGSRRIGDVGVPGGRHGRGPPGGNDRGPLGGRHRRGGCGIGRPTRGG